MPQRALSPCRGCERSGTPRARASAARVFRRLRAGSLGVSLNNFIHAAVAASVAQEETFAFFDDRLQDVDLEAVHQRVLSFMTETKPGTGPSIKALQQAMGDRLEGGGLHRPGASDFEVCPALGFGIYYPS